MSLATVRDLGWRRWSSLAGGLQAPLQAARPECLRTPLGRSSAPPSLPLSRPLPSPRPGAADREASVPSGDRHPLSPGKSRAAPQGSPATPGLDPRSWLAGGGSALHPGRALPLGGFI